MFTSSRLTMVVLTAAMFLLAHVHADDGVLSREDLASVEEATRDLAREVEYLQDLILELSGRKERTLYGQADAVLAGIEEFQRSLKPEISRERQENEFEALDEKVHNFLKAVQDLAPEQRGLLRSVARVGAADEQLHFALFSPGASDGKAARILERQAQALVIAARRLDETGEYALAVIPGRDVLVGDLHKLVEAAEQFQKKAASEADRQGLGKDFAALNQAWERVTRGMGTLKAIQNLHLLRAAGQFDRLHERLHRLLGINGERAQLIIRT